MLFLHLVDVFTERWDVSHKEIFTITVEQDVMLLDAMFFRRCFYLSKCLVDFHLLICLLLRLLKFFFLATARRYFVCLVVRDCFHEFALLKK